MKLTNTKHDLAPAAGANPAMDHQVESTASADRNGPTQVVVTPMETGLLESFCAEGPDSSDEGDLGQDTGSAAGEYLERCRKFGTMINGSDRIEGLINRDPTGFAEDSVIKAWGLMARGPLSDAAEKASLHAIQSGLASDHLLARRYHAGACSAYRAANDEARANPGLFRAEWKYHFEKGMAHDDLVFALQRGTRVDSRFQHLLEAATYLDAKDRPEDGDSKFVRESMSIRDLQEGPRIGDFVRFPDGAIHRLAREREGVEGSYQTAEPESGAFYLGGPDTLFFSCGSLSLGPFVTARGLKLTEEARDGAVWTFHNQDASPGNRVDFQVPFRVFDVIPDAGGQSQAWPDGSRIPNLLANHAEDIRAALIAYRFGDQVNYNATVDKVLRESGAELWEYIEASSTIQEKTGLALEAFPESPTWKPAVVPAPSPKPDPDDEAFDRFVADREGRLLD